MSMHQLCIYLDKFLFETFQDESLNNSEWFLQLEYLVIKNTPEKYKEIYKPYQIVLQYTKFKYMDFK
jgi:hypothetical protein